MSMSRYHQIAWALSLLVVAGAGSARAQAADASPTRDYCPSRPGLGTTPCTISAGHVSIETAVVDWTRDDTSDERDDTTLIGDTMVRVGLTNAVEAQVGWTPFGHDHTRSKLTGMVENVDSTGGLTLGVKANVRHPDGSGFAVALLPFVTLPVGRKPIADGTWSSGAVVPVSFDLTSALNLQLSPEIDAAANESGHGRHLAYGSVVGLGVAVTKAVNLTFEVAANRDNDPEAHVTEVYGAASASWMPSDNLQLDLGTNLGLDHDTPDVELYVGISRRL
jgi:hypothetical protein